MTIVGTSGLVLNEKLLFEHSNPGRKGYSLPKLDVPAAELPSDLCREDIDGFPELSEVDVVRHFTRLSTWNYGVDSGFYPWVGVIWNIIPRSMKSPLGRLGLTGF